MNRSEQDRLVEEILGAEDLAELRHATLEQGLSALRRRQRHRRALRICALSAAPVILAFALLVRARTNFSSRSATDSRSLAAAPQAGPANVAPIRYINDEELLALFPNRSVALIGKPGQQELVFLDDLAAAHRAAEADLAVGNKF